MAVEKVGSNELQFKNPEQLLVVVIGFVFWGVGLLDLIGHTSRDADIFGLYSLPFFLFILAYASTLTIWLILFFNANVLTRVTNAILAIQRNSRSYFAVLSVLAIALFVVLEWNRWSRLPALQIAALGLLVLAAIVLIGTGPQKRVRRFVGFSLLLLLGIEAVLQGLAYVGPLPGNLQLDGNFASFGRIHSSAGTLRNDFTNRNGWTYGNTPLDDEKQRVLIVGGSVAQALEVPAAAQMAPQLDSAAAERVGSDTSPVEFVSFGVTGFGLAPFLNQLIIEEMPTILSPDEIIVLFHLGNDFHSPVDEQNAIFYTLQPDGSVSVSDDMVRLRHDLTHHYLHGYSSFQLVETIRSNYLTPKVLGGLLGGGVASAEISQDPLNLPRQVGRVSNTYMLMERGTAGIRDTVTTLYENGNAFMFRPDDEAAQQEALAIAHAMLELSQETAKEHDIMLRIVTVPALPQAFYDSAAANPWQAELGGYDLLAPERVLVDIGQNLNIPTLAMGQYMEQAGLSAKEISTLFLPNGNLTAEGHSLFAAAIDDCFYGDTADNSACND